MNSSEQAEQAEQSKEKLVNFNINILKTILGNSYCLYKQISQSTYEKKYLAINLNDYKDYLVLFYPLSKISDPKERELLKRQVILKAEIFYSIESPFVTKCYGLFINYQYIAVVYDYIPEDRNLGSQLKKNQVAPSNFPVILSHVMKGIQQIHKSGYLVKKIDPSKIAFRYGYYKISDFDLFEKDFNEEEEELPSQLRKGCIQTIDDNKIDIWALGIFYLKLWIPDFFKKIDQERKYIEAKHQSLFTRELEDLFVQKRSNQKQLNFLKFSLIFRAEDRKSWEEIEYLLNGQKNKFFLPQEQPSSMELCRDNMCSRIFAVDVEQSQPSQSDQYYEETKIIEKRKYIAIFKDESLLNGRYEQIKTHENYLRSRKFSIQAIDEENLLTILKSKNDSSERIYSDLDRMYFNAQKYRLIITELVDKIQKKKLLNLKKIENIQFMYLLSAVCFTNLSKIQYELKALSNTEKKQNERIIKTYELRVQQIYKISESYFKKLDMKLKQMEKNPLQNIKNYFETLKKSKKNIYLNGILGFDYQQRERIEFIIQEYLNKQVFEQLCNQVSDKGMILPLCHHFRQIMELNDCQQLRGKNFNDCIYDILKKQNNSSKKSSNSTSSKERFRIPIFNKVLQKTSKHDYMT